MRHAIGLGLALMTAALGGCGAIAPDDPSNVPLAGKWEKSVRMVALTINDVSVDRADAPFPIPTDKTSTTCGEPFMRTRAEAQREINKVSEVRCTLDEAETVGTTVTGGGLCQMPSGGAEKVAAKLAFTAEQAPDALNLRQDFDVYIHLRDGQTEQMRLVHKVDYRRLGDCR